MSSSPPAAPLAPGARIAGYEILESLGLPGRRLVYVATDTGSRRRVVLKLAPLGDEEAAPRLRRELEVLLVAAGPGVVRAIGHGEAPHLGFAYLALEAHGPSLAAVLGASPGHRLPADQAVAAVRAAALALAELHARGWCHGDVKPGNFLFSGNGSAVLTDLECAAPLAPAERARRAGESFAATHAFVSPEVWTLGAGALSARSDVWALGVTLYFALTGVYPYGYQDPREISEAARSGAAPVFPREVPGPAAKAATQMLSYDPAKRPADGREAAERLSLALAELEVDEKLALESFLVSLRRLPLFRALTEPPTTEVPRASVGPAPAPAQAGAAAPARAPAPAPVAAMGRARAAAPPPPPPRPAPAAAQAETMKKKDEYVDISTDLVAPAKTEAAATPREEAAPAEWLRRRSAARWYSRMNPGRNFPISVVFSGKKIRVLDAPGMKVSVGTREIALDPREPYLEVEPSFAGCLVVPPVVRADVSAETTAVRFWVTPLVEGDLREACVRVRYRGQVVETLPTPAAVVTRTWARICLGMGALSPFVEKFLRGAGFTFENYVAKYFPRMVETLGGTGTTVVILAVSFLAVAIVLYRATRPLESKDEPALFAGGN